LLLVWLEEVRGKYIKKKVNYKQLDSTLEFAGQVILADARVWCHQVGQKEVISFKPSYLIIFRT
jgi:hypothetical protein